MHEILILTTAIIFYLLGRYSRGEEIQDKLQEIKKTAQRAIKPRVKAGAIDYVTPEEERYHGSPQEELDKAREKAIEKALRG